MPSSAPVGQVVFSGYSDFRPLLINNWLDISEIFLIKKEGVNSTVNEDVFVRVQNFIIHSKKFKR